jgi:twitching motility protein PilJ
MKKTLFVLLTAFCLFVCFSPLIAYAELKLGVNAERGELKAMKEWGELANYLSSEIGQPVKLVPIPVAKLLDAAENKEVDFILANPVQSVVVKEKHGFVPVATLNDKMGSQFAGVIIAKKGNGITKGSDLKGKNVMSLKFKSAAGAYLFQTYHLLQQGIDAHRDFASFKEGQKQDDLVLAVKAGVIDAAFIRSGLLESMESEGKVKIDDFVIVDKRDDSGFSFLHSTILYPEWFFSATSKTDPKITAKLKTALLKMTPDSKASKEAGIKGFVNALSTDGLKQAMKALKVAPYNK